MIRIQDLRRCGGCVKIEPIEGARVHVVCKYFPSDLMFSINRNKRINFRKKVLNFLNYNNIQKKLSIKRTSQWFRKVARSILRLFFKNFTVIFTNINQIFSLEWKICEKLMIKNFTVRNSTKKMVSRH